MANILIVHGIEASPQHNWFPWLAKELEALGHTVITPAFPHSNRPTLAEWTKAFQPYLALLDEQSVVIGHSLGPAFLLSIIQTLDHPIAGAFFVSGFIGPLGDRQYDTYRKSFMDVAFDWEQIQKNCKKFVLFNGDNDPYVPLEKGRELAGLVGGELHVVPKGGHLNADSGYTTFELLRDTVVHFL